MSRTVRKKYSINTVSEAKEIASNWLKEFYSDEMKFGLPEIDDRYNIWRVPIVINDQKIGEIVIDAITSLVDSDKTTNPEVLVARIENGLKTPHIIKKKGKKETYQPSNLRNTLALGDAEIALDELPAKSVDLVITSPPYFNARPEYSDYINYEEYLLKMRKIIQQCHRVLNEGRFFVINTSPVLLRRASRNQASKRIGVPFDLHKIFIEEGFDFMEDIIWEKPEGAGWATGRGRRFAADRTPLQYKPVPTTEHIMVFRKHTDKLIDWNIRTYPDQEAIQRSKIDDNYEHTEVWKITPAHDKKHPAIFPDELAEKVIKYYSFETDVVLDPFSGIGTAARVAYQNNRRFVGIELSGKYMDEAKKRLKKIMLKEYDEINFINCSNADDGQTCLL